MVVLTSLSLSRKALRSHKEGEIKRDFFYQILLFDLFFSSLVRDNLVIQTGRQPRPSTFLLSFSSLLGGKYYKGDKFGAHLIK